MRISLKNLPLLYLGVLALGSIFFLGPVAHAAGTSTASTPTCLQKDCALYYITPDSGTGTGSKPATYTSINIPDDIAESCLPNNFGNGLGFVGLKYTCGFKATAAGTVPNFAGAIFSAGDTVKCRAARVVSLSFTPVQNAYSCVMTHGDGSYDTYYSQGLFTAPQQIHHYNAAGVEAAPAEEVSSGQRLANQAISTASDVVSRAISAVAYLILEIANFMLGIAGTLLNWVVVKTVFKFSDLMGNSPGLLIAWGILRDIGNMILLFGFIFIGLATILDLHTYTAKKALPRLIIFAILMNFSLFAAEAVIDSSNVLSAVFYSQANTDPCAGVASGNVAESGTAGQTAEQCSENYGIAGHIMQATGLSSMYAVSQNSDPNIKASALVGMALFATIGAVVLFSTAIMLAIRAITLTFLMIFAPIGFAAMAVPPLKKMGEQWWNTLLHQSFFAPILILLIFVSLKITDGFAGSDTRQSLAAAITQPGASVMGIIMIFVLVTGFMMASLIAAKKFGAAGASFAISTAGKMTGGATLGLSAWGARQTIGRGGSAFSQAIRNSRLGATETGRRLALIGDKGAKASFDLRGTKAFQGAAKGAGGKALGGIDFGGAQKGGFAGSVKKAKEARTEYAESLKGGTEGKKDYEARIAKISGETTTQLEATNAASSAHQDAVTSREAEEQKVEEARRLATNNPGIPGLKKSLEAQEKILEERQKEEAAAEAKLTEETNKLAAARAAEKSAREGGRIQMDAKQQQQRYAANLGGPFSAPLNNVDNRHFKRVINATFMANRQAIAAISKEIKKDPTEKGLDKILKYLKESGHDTGHTLEHIEHELHEAHEEAHDAADHAAPAH